MKIKMRASFWLLFVPFLLGSVPVHSAPRPAKPRLVVLISVDQFRGDYLTRFPELLLPAKSSAGVGGFRYVMEGGAYYPNAQYGHYPLFTGPGHAVLSTGASGATNGIIGNEWYVPGRNGQPGRELYCVEDDASAIVGSDSKMGISPRTLRSTTVADELKMATNGRARVLTVGLKDRASVLLAGRLSDTTIWFDNTAGGWVTSQFYRPDGTLPAWVKTLNDKRWPDSYFGKVWTPLMPQETAKHAWAPAGEPYTPSETVGKHFPHKYDGGLTAPGRQFYADFWNSPFANEYVLNSTLEGIRALDIGLDEVPDFVGINLASNDYVGHSFGPNSPESFDMTLRTDRYLADFFRALDRHVKGGLKNVVIAISADHGVSPIPEHMSEAGFHAGRVPHEAVTSAADSLLDTSFGPGDWVSAFVEPGVWLNHDEIVRKNVDAREVRRLSADAMRQVEGIYDIYTRDQLSEGRLPRTMVADKVSKGFHPRVSGDFLVVTENLWFPGSRPGGTTHGSPWAYDTHVPIVISGPGIRPGVYQRVASAQEIAPTLSTLLGVGFPSACTSPPLVDALQ